MPSRQPSIAVKESVTALQGVTPFTGVSDYKSIYVIGEGFYVWREGDQSANLPDATNEWVAPETDTSGASGAWQKDVGTGATLSADETEYWEWQAALLDPAAYVYMGGPSFSVTVPTGETWLIINLWNVEFNGTSTMYNRPARTDQALYAPEGTTLASNGNNGSTLYFCRPTLVTGNAEYASPKDLYFSRVSSLRALDIETVELTMPLGSSAGTRVDTDLPTDFGDGVIKEAVVHDVSWISSRNGVLPATGINLQNEVSDDHAVRFTETLLTPFVRPQLPAVEIRAGSISGNGSDTSLAGKGFFLYSKLPSTFRSTPSRPLENAMLADSPRRLYNMDDLTGTTTDDIGADGVDGSYEGSVTFGALPPTYDGTTGTTFFGNTTRVRVPAAAVLDFGSSDWTVEFFVKFDRLGVSGNDPWIYNYWQTDTDVTNAVLIAYNASVGGMRLLVETTSSGTITLDSSFGSMVVDTWYHVIAGRDGSNLFLRVVGEETRQTATISDSVNDRSSDLHLAAGWNSSGSAFQFGLEGSLFNVAIYDSAISDARADAHADAIIGQP